MITEKILVRMMCDVKRASFGLYNAERHAILEEDPDNAAEILIKAVAEAKAILTPERGWVEAGARCAGAFPADRLERCGRSFSVGGTDRTRVRRE